MTRELKHPQDYIYPSATRLAPTPRVAMALILALTLANQLMGEIVFDNTFRYANAWYASKLEIGDDVALSGKARVISSFHVEYFGEFIPLGQEQARIRFYANDGPGSSPGTLLFASEPVPIYPGYNVASLRQLALSVPDQFIWSIEFEGLTGVYNRRAGLIFYDPPVLGSSYKDFWVKQEGKWNTFIFGEVAANFSVRIFAEPDPPVEIVADTVGADGARQLMVAGPNFRSGELWWSDDQSQWQRLRAFNFCGRPVRVIDAGAPAGTTRYYRASLSAEPVLELSSFLNWKSDKQQRIIRVTGLPGSTFGLETGFRFSSDWLPLPYNTTLVSGVVDVVDPPGSSFGTRFYRAAGQPDLSVILGDPVLLPDGHLQLLAAGPPGRDGLLQSTEDLVSWTSMATNTFGYTSSSFQYTIAFTNQPTTAYYRVLLLPYP